jgi:hypothetical protein
MSTSNPRVKYSITITLNSQNVSNNTSNVTVSVRFRRTNTGYTTSGNGTLSCKIDGIQYSADVTTSQKITSSGIILFSKTLDVSHDSEDVNHVSEAVSNDSESFSHVSEAVSNDSESFSHDSEDVSHVSEDVSHNSEAVSNNSESFSHDSESFSHNSAKSLTCSAWINLNTPLDFLHN